MKTCGSCINLSFVLGKEKDASLFNPCQKCTEHSNYVRYEVTQHKMCHSCLKKEQTIQKLREDVHASGNNAQVIIAENMIPLLQENKRLKQELETLKMALNTPTLRGGEK